MENEIINRINILRYIIKLKKIDAFVVSDKREIYYLTGFYKEEKEFSSFEECLLISHNKSFLISRDLDRKNLKKNILSQCYNLVYIKTNLKRKLYLTLISINASIVSFENGCFFYNLYINYYLNKKSKIIKIIQTKDIIKNIRVIKSQYEENKTIISLRISEKAFLIFINSIRRYITEKKAYIVLKNIMHNLGTGILAFTPIVASGFNKSFPHSIPIKNTIKINEIFVVDCGIKACGYSSDFTRVVSFDYIDYKFLKTYKIILNVQIKSIFKLRYGTRNKNVDLFARAYIGQKGYFGNFIHGLGHGTGLSVHELPRIYKHGNLFFENGMILTIEPGLYIPNWTGIRIENQIVVKKKKFKILNKLSLNIYNVYNIKI